MLEIAWLMRLRHRFTMIYTHLWASRCDLRCVETSLPCRCVPLEAARRLKNDLFLAAKPLRSPNWLALCPCEPFLHALTQLL